MASVGLSQAQARQAGLAVRVGATPMAATARGWIHGPGAEHGVVKLVADADQGVLVGGSVMGPAAGEIAGLLVLAIWERIPVTALRGLIYPYPTFVRGVEGAFRQLRASAGRRAHQPRQRRLASAMRRAACSRGPVAVIVSAR